MKVNIQKWLKRGSPLITVFTVIFVSIVAFPADAVAYDYNDLPHTVTVDGSNDIVTVTLDPAKGAWELYRPHDKTLSASGDTITIPENYANIGMYYQFFPHWSGLDPASIPDGTVFSCTVRCIWDEQLPHDSGDPKYALFLQSRSTAINIVGQNEGSVTSGDYTNDIVISTCTYHAFAGTEYISPILNIYGFNTDRAMTIQVVSCTFTMTISSLYRQQQLTGKTNELLGEVEKQLEANGQKLDDIISGTPEDQDKADQFAQEATGAIGDLQAAGDAMEKVQKPEVAVSDLVPTDILGGTAFLAYTGVISEFWNNKTLTLLLMTLGGFLIISYVLYGGKDS